MSKPCLREDEGRGKREKEKEGGGEGGLSFSPDTVLLNPVSTATLTSNQYTYNWGVTKGKTKVTRNIFEN